MSEKKDLQIYQECSNFTFPTEQKFQKMQKQFKTKTQNR